jgi:hypothetical protein
MVSNESRGETGLFSPGPPLHALRRLVARGGKRGWYGVIVAMTVAWLPPAILAASGNAAAHAFLNDFAAHAKYLLAVPLLLIADWACAPRLAKIAGHFLDAGIVRRSQQAQFDSIVASARDLGQSWFVGVGVIVLAYAIVAALYWSVPVSDLPQWHQASAAGATVRSPAGWWVFLVSLPLLLSLILGWTWRWFLWTRLLWQISRLDLHLLASHPDRAAGLTFVSYSVRACWPLACAFTAMLAGDVANAALHQGAPLLDYKYLVVEAIVFTVMFITAPLVVFSVPLLRTWRRGVFEYGALAERCGREFEQKWLAARNLEAGESLLRQTDGSTVSSLYHIVDRVYDLRLVPVDFISVVMLVLVALLPFVLVILMTLPIEAILDHVAGFLM